MQYISPSAALVENNAEQFDDWFTEDQVLDVIVLLQPDGKVTIRCRDAETVKRRFQCGGMPGLLSYLQPPGWSATETECVSPPGVNLSKGQALAAAWVVGGFD